MVNFKFGTFCSGLKTKLVENQDNLFDALAVLGEPPTRGWFTKFDYQSQKVRWFLIPDDHLHQAWRQVKSTITN